MIFIILFLFFFLKIGEKFINKLRRQSYKLNAETTVLITGACSGIGKQLALNFAKNLKCHIIIYDLLTELPKPFEEEIENLGGKAHYFKCDITRYDEVDKVLEKTFKEFSKIDILVNNAGIVVGKSVLDLKMEEIEKVTAVNYFGPIYLLKQLLPKMQTLNKGHIVNISSVVHCLYATNLAEYCGSKAAIYNFHASMRLELKRSGSKIANTIICPYVINTGMFKGTSVRLAWFFRTLNEVEVGKIIFDSILEKREIVYIPWYYGNLWALMNLILPLNILERLLLFLSDDAMDNFVGRHKKE